MTFAPAMDYPKIGFYSEGSLSATRRELVSALMKRQPLSNSAMDWSPSVAANMEEIRRECSQSNWDGDEARPISSAVLEAVMRVVHSLNTIMPRSVPAPDIIPENDGEICLSWDLADGRVFSMSIGEHGKMNYAGQLGKKGAVHGWQPIDISDPRSLREDIEEVARQIIKLYS